MINIVFTIICILLFGSYDLFIKFAASKSEPVFGAFVVQLVSAVFLGIVLFVSKESTSKFSLHLYPVTAGALIASALLILFTLLKNPNSQASIILPTTLIGRNLVLIILSVIVFKESLNAQQVVGVMLSVAGLALIHY